MSSITGRVKVIDVPDDACLTTVRDLMMQMEKFLAVEFDASEITNVVVSTEEPDATDGTVVWFRINNSGNFIGIYVFVQGQWLQMFPPPQGIFRMYGSSNEIPEGYDLITEDTPGFTSAMVSKLQEGWYLGDEGWWLIFDVVYVGL